MSAALLLREPETETHGFLARRLLSEGFELVDRGPDLVLLGDVAELDRWRGEDVPVIVLGRPESPAAERVSAFERGCDDYVAKPFDYAELVARIRAVLRRSAPSLPEIVEAGPVEIDLAARRVSVNDEPVELAQKEYELLLKLALEPQRVFTKEELLREVWGYVSMGCTRTLDTHASRLRGKLRRADGATRYVVNVWGVGYRLFEE